MVTNLHLSSPQALRPTARQAWPVRHGQPSRKVLERSQGQGGGAGSAAPVPGTCLASPLPSPPGLVSSFSRRQKDSVLSPLGSCSPRWDQQHFNPASIHLLIHSTNTSWMPTSYMPDIVLTHSANGNRQPQTPSPWIHRDATLGRASSFLCSRELPPLPTVGRRSPNVKGSPGSFHTAHSAHSSHSWLRTCPSTKTLFLCPCELPLLLFPYPDGHSSQLCLSNPTSSYKAPGQMAPCPGTQHCPGYALRPGLNVCSAMQQM